MIVRNMNVEKKIISKGEGEETRVRCWKRGGKDSK